jgi:AraC-like DNA-binding protein
MPFLGLFSEKGNPQFLLKTLEKIRKLLYFKSFLSFAGAKSMETQERILQTAETIFMRMGIRSVSMDDISAELGMSKKTLYQYFEDKDQLVTTVVTRQFKTKMSRTRGLCQPGAQCRA